MSQNTIFKNAINDKNDNQILIKKYINQINQNINQKINTNLDNQNDYATIQQYKVKGWYPKNNKVFTKMIKFKQNALCYGCLKLYKYNEFNYSKIISYDDVKKIGLKTNIICICNECQSTLNKNDIPFAPKTIKDLYKLFDVNIDLLTIRRNLVEDVNNQIEELEVKHKRLEDAKTNFILRNNKIVEKNRYLLDNIELEKKKTVLLTSEFKHNQELMNEFSIRYNNFFNDMTNRTKNLLDQSLDSFNLINQITEKKVAECKICMLNNVNLVIIPCGHTICSECSKSCQTECPMCRVSIQSKMKIYI